MRIGFVAAAVCLTLAGSPVRAEYLMSDLDIPALKNDVSAYMAGIFAGYGWYNTALRQKGEKPLFCEPQGQVTTLDTVRSTLLGFSEKLQKGGISHNEVMTYPIGLTLLRAFEDQFPCSSTTAAAKLSVCNMTEAQANSSPNCLRYYFVCKNRTDPKKVSAGTPELNRMARYVRGTIALLQSEQSCDSYDYSQAYSAFHLEVDGP